MDNCLFIHGLQNSNHWLYRMSNKITLGYSRLIIDDKSYFLYKRYRNYIFYINNRRVKDIKTYDVLDWDKYHKNCGYYNLEYLNFLPEITFTDTFYSLVFLHNLPDLNKNMPYPSGLITEFLFKE